MKNTKVEIQKEILKVQSQIREIQKNLKNSKDYLKYLKECFEDEQKEEEEEEEVFVCGCATCGIDTEETDINGNCNNCK
jgi:Skp family chaperone for outer membrane proteins